MIEGLSQRESDSERRELQRMFAEQNAWSNEEEIDEITTPIEEYNVFAGEMAHPADRVENLREFHDSFMIDLQPHKDAVHADRVRREAKAAERRRERIRERYNEHGEITKFVTVA